MLSIADLALLVSASGLPERLKTLIELFLGDGIVPWRAVERCLRTSALDALIAIGMVRRSHDEARAVLRITPFHDLCLLVDRLDAVQPTAVHDPDRSTSSLVPFVLARRGDRALDIGAGSGAIALIAARSFREVLALDINPRAIQLTRWNAMLNGVRVIARECPPSPLDGLPAARFDLVTFAMPFLVGEASPRLHTHSPSGHRLFEDVYRGVARVLTPRGGAVLWHQIAAEPGAFERQLAAVPCGEALAVVWNGPIHEGVGWQMGRALVTRRARGAPGVTRVPVPVSLEEGRLSDRQRPADIARFVRTQALVRAGELDALVPRVYSYVTAHRRWRVARGRLAETPTVQLSELAVSPEVLELLAACDGRTVRELSRRWGGQARAIVRQLAEAGVVSLARARNRPGRTAGRIARARRRR
jgi:SAM-dependent methyltransferase